MAKVLPVVSKYLNLMYPLDCSLHFHMSMVIDEPVFSLENLRSDHENMAQFLPVNPGLVENGSANTGEFGSSHKSHFQTQD